MPARSKLAPTKGFTYVGVLFILALASLASAMTMQVTEQSGRRDAETELLAVGREFSRAFESYYLQSTTQAYRYPRQLSDLVRDPRVAGIKRHLRRIYPDPLTGHTEWGLIPAPGGGIMGVYSLAKGEPIRDGNAVRGVPTPLVASSAASGVAVDVSASYEHWQFGYMPPALSRRLRRPN